MIITSEINNLKDWIEANRPDKESNKPYLIEEMSEDGAYILPEDKLIEQGLSELNQEFSIVHHIRGISVILESKYFE
jgi:hypothetical protein